MDIAGQRVSLVQRWFLEPEQAPERQQSSPWLGWEREGRSRGRGERGGGGPERLRKWSGFWPETPLGLRKQMSFKEDSLWFLHVCLFLALLFFLPLWFCIHLREGSQRKSNAFLPSLNIFHRKSF